MTLLHYIVQTVQERFPDVSNFDNELKSTEKAAQGKRRDHRDNSNDSNCVVSLENIQIDVQDLTRGLDNAKKELVIRQTMMVNPFFSNVLIRFFSNDVFFYFLQNVETRSLEDFLNFAQEKIDRLSKDAKLAQDAFNQCVEYFGKN